MDFWTRTYNLARAHLNCRYEDRVSALTDSLVRRRLTTPWREVIHDSCEFVRARNRHESIVREFLAELG
jgi:hypothetical protein